MLELQHVSFDVSDERDKNIGIIADLSLVIPDRKFVVVTGPNGGGKSTLARLIAGQGKDGNQLRLPAAGPLQGPAGA